jgi:hypothetical protein
MMFEFIYLIWFLTTLGCTYFAALIVHVAFDERHADKRFTTVAVMVTSVTFFSWYMLYINIPKGII